MTTTSRGHSFRLQARAVVALAAIWVLLWGEPSLLNITFGLILGWLITRMFWLAPIRYEGRVHPWRLLKLILIVLKDLATASVQLAMAAFRGRIDLRPGIIRVKLRSDNDLYQVIVAQLISIVPGTLVVDTTRHPRTLYLHVFDLPDAEAATRERERALAVERRLVAAVGSPEEIEAVWR